MTLIAKKDIEFIINPIAGTRSKLILEDLIHQHLDLNIFNCSISYTKARGHAQELASLAVQKGVDYVVAVGGDGTVNEVARALIHEKSTLGIVPVGSGNGLARHLGIPLSPTLAIEKLNKQKQILIDAGMANSRPFFCTAGIGFDAHIGRKFAMSTTRGFNTYVRTVLQEFLQYKSHTYSIQVDQDPAINIEAFSITFANAAQFGNNAYISPEADISDGKLDLCLIKKYPKRVGLHLGMRLFNKTIHKSRYMTIRKIESAVVNCTDADCFHLDGEFLLLDGELKLEIIPQCLNILVP